MKDLPIILATVLVLSSSASMGAEPGVRANVLVLKRVTPAAGAVVNERSVIEADIEYAIAAFDAAKEYYIAPMFDSTDPPGSTFNKNNHVSDGLRIEQPSGTAHLRYPMNREWTSGKLARPVRVRFVLTRSLNPQNAIILTKSTAVTFAVRESSPHTDRSPAVETILSLEERWRVAQQANDTAAFHALLAPDVTFIGTSGTLRDLAGFIESRRTSWIPHASSYAIDEVRVRFYGSVAVVTGRGSTTGQGTAASGRFTHVWAKRNSRWALVAVQRTEIAPP